MAGLWIPPFARESQKSDKTYRCTLCGARFPEYQRRVWEQHVARCAKRNEDIPERMAHQRDDNAFTGIYDEEQYRWLRSRAAERRA